MTTSVHMCRCGGGPGPHTLGSGACEYPRPRAALYALRVPRPTETRLAPVLVAGASGERDDKAWLNYIDEVKADYQRRLIRQSNAIQVLRDEVIILKDVQIKLTRMIEELLEMEFPDVDTHLYLRKLRRLTDETGPASEGDEAASSGGH